MARQCLGADHRPAATSPLRPEGRRANTVSFPAVSTARLRIVLTPRPGSAAGLTEVEAWSRAALPLSPAAAPSPDLAYGAAVSASFTSRYDHLSEVNDMVVAFSHYSRNRWTAFGSPNASDWVEVDLRAPTRIGTVELYLWGDGGGVKAPKRYTIQTWDGSRWVDAEVVSKVPLQPQVSSVNTVRIVPVETGKVRVVFEHDLPAASGMTEVIIREAGQ